MARSGSMKTSLFVGVCALTITAYAGAAPAQATAKPAAVKAAATTPDSKTSGPKTGTVGKTPTSPVTGTSSAVPADGNAATTLTASSTAPSTATNIYGVFEVRPTNTSNNGEFHTENTLEAGYKFNSTTKFRYIQWFTTNLAPKVGTSDYGQGLNLKADDGHFNLKADKIYSFDKDNYIGYEGRVFVPTEAGKREAGFLTYMRHYIKFAHEFGSLVTVELREAPSYHFYTRPGFGGKANPSFENHVVLNADVHITKAVTFSLPFYYFQTKYRSGAGAANDGEWGYKLVAWPELDWDITANHTVGVAFRTSNLLTSSHGTNFDDGFKTGVWQFVYTLTL